MEVNQQQTSGIDQFNQAVSQMDQVSHKNATLVEEAGVLPQTVGVFKFDEPRNDLLVSEGRLHA